MGEYLAICDRCNARVRIKPFVDQRAAELPIGWQREAALMFCPICVRRIELERLAQARR